MYTPHYAEKYLELIIAKLFLFLFEYKNLVEIIL